MCLLFIAWRPESPQALIVAANRDEFHGRPALPAAPWDDAPQVVGGRDLQAGGTWLGIAAPGRFCALTNYREPSRPRPGAPSRGALVSTVLRSAQPVFDVLKELRERIDGHAGFNLLAADGEGLWLLSNRATPALQSLPPGIYGLSNGALDADWPKVRRGKRRLSDLLETGEPPVADLFALLADEQVLPDDELPRTGLDLAWERLLSPAFIRHPQYGTRCSTVVMGDAAGTLRLVERRFDAAGQRSGQSDWTLPPDGHARGETP